MSLSRWVLLSNDSNVGLSDTPASSPLQNELDYPCVQGSTLRIPNTAQSTVLWNKLQSSNALAFSQSTNTEYHLCTKLQVFFRRDFDL